MLGTFIEELSSLGERQGAIALRAAEQIESHLEQIGVPFTTYDYPTAIPVCEGMRLLIDGREIPVLNCSFSGGRIETGCEVITSLQSSQNHFFTPNINYNEKSVGLSTPNYYSAPAFAIRPEDVQRVRSAKRIEGESIVRQVGVVAREILVGNLAAPRGIVFSHFDSLFTGAVDNASGTAVMLELLREHPGLARDHLFIFDGNEELSYDHPVYWGYGYRVFEQRFSSLLDSARHLCVVDCVGYDPPIAYNDPESLRVAFPLRKTAAYAAKTTIIAGSIDGLMKFYHSAADLPGLIAEEHLRQAMAEVLHAIGESPSRS